MPLFEISIGTVGIALGILSLVLYWRRTHDREFWSRLWLSRGLLTRSEYVLNRVGFAIAIAAVIRMGVDVVAMVYYHR
jgi:hypothetical protein